MFKLSPELTRYFPYLNFNSSPILNLTVPICNYSSRRKTLCRRFIGTELSTKQKNGKIEILEINSAQSCYDCPHTR